MSVVSVVSVVLVLSLVFVVSVVSVLSVAFIIKNSCQMSPQMKSPNGCICREVGGYTWAIRRFMISYNLQLACVGKLEAICSCVNNSEWQYGELLTHSVRFRAARATRNEIIATFSIRLPTTYDKVNRCLARYSPCATTTSQPTNRAPKPMRHLFCVENIDRWGSNWLLGAKMCYFDPKFWIFGAKSQFFV